MRMRLSWHYSVLCGLMWALLSSSLSAQRAGFTQPQPPVPEPPKFRFMGPATNGRASAVVGIPGDTSTYYLGAASGGIWKSTDSGKTWAPIFDDQTSAAIGALAIAPSDARTVWAGTGEAWVIRPTDMMGDGIYKSTDAGASWKRMGLEETGRIGRIIVHPTNPNVVFACALGRATGPQQERGVYRTSDGGATWQRVLFVNADTGCSGLSMDAKNPDVLMAGTWQVVMHTWAMFSGGAGSGVHISRDGGTNWKKVEHQGLPKSPVGKVDVAIAPSNPQRVYALIQTASQGSLWRSDDGGAAWKVVSWDRTLIGRAGYYIRLGISPKDENEVFVMSSSPHRSTDGGLTFTDSRGCGDCHDMWIDPTNPDHYVVTGDATHGITTNHGQSFTSVSLPIGQMYHVAVDNRAPYWIYSNRQDNGTMRGPSNAPVPVPNVPSYAPAPPAGGRGGRGGGGRGGAPQAWDENIGGCESGFTIPDPVDPDIIWASCYGNKLTRYEARTKTARSVAPWMITLDSPPTASRYRCHWTAPVAVDPFDHNTVYYGCQVIFRTVNAGQTWSVISPDLSTQDPSKIVSSGGVVGDNLGQFAGEVVFAIAPSPIQKGLIWAGTNDGKIWNTNDAGKTWNDLSANVTGMPPWGTVNKIEPSNFDAGTAYAVVDYHIMDTRDPFIFKTTDFGKTWKKISDGLPKGHPLAYAITMAENPNRKAMLFAGTGNGFYYSLNDGETWQRFTDGLPPAPVTWIVVQKQHHDVAVSTYGRGLYILHDITTLEQSDTLDTSASAQLYAPRPGWRMSRSGRVELTYALKAAGPVQLEILDASGALIRKMEAQGRAGLNSAVWDLRYDPPAQVELRTTAPDNPYIWDEPRFKGQTVRPVTHWGIQQPQRAGPIGAPGKYTIQMTAGGMTTSRPVEVLKDPAIARSDEDLTASTTMQIRIRDDINATASMANRMEIMRKQIEDQRKANTGRADVDRALADLDKKILDVELRLLSRSDLHSDDKWFVEPYKVYLNLLWLSGAVGTGAGDEAGGADYAPTDAQVAVLAEIEKELGAATAAYAALVKNDVPAFNARMKGKVTPITVP